MALGVGAWTAAFFHLFTHAMFKAGLFLGSGSVAHSVHSFDMKEHMGGMKRFMPKTYWTFVICTARPHRHLPAGRLLVEGRDPRRRRPAGRPATRRSWSSGLVGAFMTAAYMTRCVYLTFHGEPRGHAADEHHPPHESGPRIVRAALHPQRPGHRRRLRQPPEHRCARLGARPVRACASSTSTSRRASTSRPCSTRSTTPSSASASRSISTVIGLIGIAPGLRLVLPQASGPTASPSATRWPGPATRSWWRSTTSTTSTPTSSSGRVKGPIAKAAYWFNQKGIDGVDQRRRHAPP